MRQPWRFPLTAVTSWFANSGSDTLNVIDTRMDQVVEKVWARQTPADLFGAQPNALVFDPAGERLHVCNGTQNAVAGDRVRAGGERLESRRPHPVGWFPGAILYDPRRDTLCVANVRVSAP